jgi:hypothetical protein
MPQGHGNHVQGAPGALGTGGNKVGHKQQQEQQQQAELAALMRAARKSNSSYSPYSAPPVVPPQGYGSAGSGSGVPNISGGAGSGVPNISAKDAASIVGAIRNQNGGGGNGAGGGYNVADSNVSPDNGYSVQEANGTTTQVMDLGYGE